MASSFSTLFVSLLLSSLLPTPLYAARSSRFRPAISPALDLPRQEAERLLRSFNLFPNHDINKPFEDPSFDVAPMMVERPIRFNIAGSPGPSVPEFGHYAGYYRLPNTKAARYCQHMRGFAIGNGLTDPAIQYNAYTDFSLANKLIGQSDYDRINKMVPACEQAIKACGTDGEATCEDAFYACTSIFLEILSVAGNINYYDIRKTCHGELCYDFSAIETFLNNETVKEALGVKGIDFVSCSIQVHHNMTNDWMRDLEVGIPALLEEGIQVLIYAGEKDLICNWLGNSRWVHTMIWSGQKEFVAAPTIAFVVDGEKAGEMKSHGPLTFLKVYEAGHMVPMDQPNSALQMLKRWLQGKFGSTRQL